MGLDSFVIYNVLWYFAVYSFLGWCTEVVYAAVTEGTFVNRGFLNGPVCPIYGFGMIIIIICLTPVKGNIILLFAGSVILTTALELVAGVVLEKVFKTRWWDYFDYPFNIGGYVCLAFSLMWGLGCIVIMRIIHPIIAGFTAKTYGLAGFAVLSVVLLTMVIDTVVTVISVMNLNKRLKQLDEVAQNLREISDELGENISKKALAFRAEEEKLKELLQDRYPEAEKLLHKQKELLFSRHSIHKRLLKAFPSIKSTSFSEALDKLKEHLNN